MAFKKISVFFIALLIPGIALTQVNKSLESDIFYRNEKSIGLELYSYGFGISYRNAKRIDYFNKRNFEVEINTIKHPKEEKVSNPTFSGSKFVYGKKNETINTRWGFGKQKEIFSRKHEGSITIKFLYQYGIDLTLQKPIFYEIIVPVDDAYGITYEKFDETSHTLNDIRAKAPFSEGLNDISINPGAYGKLAFSFEFMTKKNITHNLEGGLICDIYPWELEIMALSNNQQFFYSLFISYRLGLIVDAKKAEDKKREKSNH